MGDWSAKRCSITSVARCHGSEQLVVRTTRQFCGTELMTSIAAGERHGGGGASHSSTDPEYARKRKDYIAKQQRWLLFLRHCAKCQSADNACQYGQSCAIAKQLWRHILTCSDGNCTYSRWALHPLSALLFVIRF